MELMVLKSMVARRSRVYGGQSGRRRRSGLPVRAKLSQALLIAAATASAPGCPSRSGRGRFVEHQRQVDAVGGSERAVERRAYDVAAVYPDCGGGAGELALGGANRADAANVGGDRGQQLGCGGSGTRPAVGGIQIGGAWATLGASSAAEAWSRCSSIGLPCRNKVISSRVVPISSGTLAAEGGSDRIESMGAQHVTVDDRAKAVLPASRQRPAEHVGLRREECLDPVASSSSTVRVPSCCRIAAVVAAASAGSRARRPGPLWMIALCNKPSAAGAARRAATFAPPPDCPKIVTLPGSPPKAEMLSRNQRRAAILSSSPALPDVYYSGPAISKSDR